MSRIFPPLTSSPFSRDATEQQDTQGRDQQRKPVFQEHRPTATTPTPAAPETPSAPVNTAPTDEDAQKAIKTLLQWAGEDVTREGLKDTPERVVRTWKAFFAGYKTDPKTHLQQTAPNANGYNDMICVENVRIVSFCEQTLSPITGTAFIAYIPAEKIAAQNGLIALAQAFGARLQGREKMTRQIAQAINEAIAPKGVAVAIRFNQPQGDIFTMATYGAFETDQQKRAEFLGVARRAA